MAAPGLEGALRRGRLITCRASFLLPVKGCPGGRDIRLCPHHAATRMIEDPFLRSTTQRLLISPRNTLDVGTSLSPSRRVAAAFSASPLTCKHLHWAPIISSSSCSRLK